MMKKVMIVLFLVVILSFSITIYAGWEITSHSTTQETKYASSPSATNRNPNQDLYITATFSRSVSKNVTISTSGGFTSVVEAHIGYSNGQTITDTVSSSVNLPPLRSVDWYVDWRISKHMGSAQYRGIFGNITDTGSWSATVPLYPILSGYVYY